MRQMVIFIWAYSAIALANPCGDSFSARINEAIRFNQEQIDSYKNQNRLYRALSEVLEGITSDPSQDLTQREIDLIITALENKGMREIVTETLKNNMPQSERLLLALTSLLDRLEEVSLYSDFEQKQTRNAAAGILVNSLDEPGLKGSSDLQLIQLLKYPEVIRQLTPERIQGLSPEEVRTLTSEQRREIFNTFVPATVGYSDAFRKSAVVRNNTKKVVTLEQIQMLPPEEIKEYVSRLPFAWIRRLTPEQKQMIIQGGIDRLSSGEIRALGGLNVFQRKNSGVRNGIQKLRPQLNARERFILDRFFLSENPLTLDEISHKYSVSSGRIQKITETVMRKIKRSILDVS